MNLTPSKFTARELIIMLARRLERPTREIAESVGVSRERVNRVLRRHAPEIHALRLRSRPRTTATYRECAYEECGREFRARSQDGQRYCSRACWYADSRDESSIGARAYRLRRDERVTWREVAKRVGMGENELRAMNYAKKHAQSRGLPWPVVYREDPGAGATSIQSPDRGS